ncbi:MAG: hypothetical protein ACT4P4_03475 [Betaproteobacteria bacterium]
MTSEERGFIAQMFFDRLHDAGATFAIVGDTAGYPERCPAEVTLALPAGGLGAMPRTVARFAQDLDLRLVHLERPAPQRWRAMLAWGDAQGRHRFLGVRMEADYYLGARRMLAWREQLSRESALRFIRELLHGFESGELAERWLAQLWAEDARGAIEQVARFWRTPAEIRVVAQAAKHGEWTALRDALPRLRQALLRSTRASIAALPEYLLSVFDTRFRSPRARIAFTGRESAARNSVMAEVSQDLAPLNLVLFEERPGSAHRADFRVVFDVPPGFAVDTVNAAAIPRNLGREATLAATERAILAWLELRVERRFPGVTVGQNPLTARLAQRFRPSAALLGSALRSPVRSPILMPYPYGIVIEDGVRIGRRVTVMQQVMIGRGAVVEDNVTLGAGAKLVGPVRVGRGAVVAPNAVVSADVPSHAVVGERRSFSSPVVNS